MSEDRKAGAIILSNIGMFDEATRLLETIDSGILQNVCEIVEKWVNDNGWEGSFDHDEVDIWLAPPDWSTNEEDEFFSSFAWGPRNEDDSSWVADICGQGQEEVGFRFNVNHSILGGKKKWNNFCKNMPDYSERLAQLGFVAEEKGAWFIPVKVDKDSLAKAYEEDDSETALEEPIVKVLEQIKAAFPIFDKIIQAGKKACL